MAIGENLRRRAAQTFPALKHRNFRLFWFGQCISLIGTWMQNIGQSWLVLQLTGSPLKLGYVSAIQFLPVMLFSLFAGPLVDRFPKRRVLIFTQSSLAVLAAILATLTRLGVVRYWHILVLAALLGIINTLDMPTRQAFIIELVGREDLMNAIALNSSVFNLARIIGPAVAGFLIGLVGIAVCFYLNALSFLAVIAGLLLMDITTAVPLRTRQSLRDVLQNIGEGLRYIAVKPLISMPLILLAAISLFVMNFNVTIPIFAKHDLGQNAAGYGLLMTAMGAGSLLGALALAARSKKGPRLRLMLGGALGMSVFLAILGLERSYLWAASTLLLVGLASITLTASVNTMIQLNSEDRMRGRVMSVYSLVFAGVTPIGSLYAGKVTDLSGAPGCLIISGLIGALASLVIAIALYRKQTPAPASYPAE
jgi:MFS family permease